VTPATTPETEGGIKGLFGGMNMDTLMKGAIAAQMLSGLIPKGGGDDEEEDPNAGKERYSEDEIDADFDTSIPDIKYVDRKEHNFFPGMVRFAADGGLIRGYANGGIVGLANGGDIQAQRPMDLSMPLNGVPNGQGPAAIPESTFPDMQIGSPFGDEEIPASTSDDKELIAAAVAAIQGKLPNADQIILAFIKEFGEEAFQDLVGRVKGLGQNVPDDGRLISGPGTGTSDSIPAVINGPGGEQQPAALSDGEYVVPARAVKALGGGSTEAGAGRLDEMVQAADGGLISLMRG
jgi:hypothetical protein